MSKHGIENRIEELKQQTHSESTLSPTVEWRDAAPEERPEGIELDPDTETLYYDVWEAQRETLEAMNRPDTDIVAMLGGYATGKSIFGARWVVSQALKYPNSRFLAMGMDFAKARGTTFKILKRQLPGPKTELEAGTKYGPESSPIVENYDKHKLTLTNDSVIKFGSADRGDRYAGDEFGAVWLDEVSNYGDELHRIYETIGSRFRGVDGPKTQLWTLTGEGFNAAWELLEKQRDVNGDPVGLEIETVRASTTENPYLGEDTIAQLKRQFGGTDMEDRALHGAFGASRGRVYSCFTREEHVIPHSEAVERTDDSWRIYGYDSGWTDPRVLLEIGKTDYDQLVALDTFHQTESHVEDAIQWVEGHNKPKGPIYAEHEPAHINRFQNNGFQATKAAKSLDAGIADVRRRLETDQTDRVGLFVSDRCEELIREFLGYQRSDTGTTTGDDHCLDALRYAIHTSNADKQDKEWATTDSGKIRTPIVRGVKGGLFDA